MKYLIRLFLRIEYSFHAVDAYLAAWRDDRDALIDSDARATNVWDRIRRMEVTL